MPACTFGILLTTNNVLEEEEKVFLGGGKQKTKKDNGRNRVVQMASRYVKKMTVDERQQE